MIHTHVGDDRITPSAEWIRLAHTGKVDPWTADLASIDTLARYYGVNPAQLHPALEARLAVIGREWAGPERVPAKVKERRRTAVKTEAASAPTRSDNDPPSRRYAQPVADLQAYRLLTERKPEQTLVITSDLGKAAA